MKFAICKLENSKRYGFIIGTRAKPDSLLKEQIRNQFEEAMTSLKRSEKGYSVSILHSETAEEGTGDLPSLETGSTYLIFGLLGSETGERPSDEELEDQKNELFKGIEAISPGNSRVALIVLYDASVKWVEAGIYYPIDISTLVGNAGPSRWTIGEGSSLRPWEKY